MTHKPIKTEFRWTGDGYGAACARVFKQLVREGDVAIYERTVEKTGHVDGYEVIKVGRHNGYTLGGQYVEPAETYPGSSQFGHNAWSCASIERAKELFTELVNEAKNLAALTAAGKAPKKRGRPKKNK